MDQAALVERDIEDGRRLVQALDAAAFPVVAACWFFVSDEDVWRLLIASPKVAELGPIVAYTEIQGVLRKSVPTLPLPRISAVPPDDPIVTELRIFAGTASAPFVGGTHLHRTALGDLFIEGAYVYRAERIVGGSAKQEISVALEDRQSKVWTVYPCTLTFKEGFLDEVTNEGPDWPQTRSRNGVNIQLNVLSHVEAKAEQAIGDVQHWTWKNGRLRSVETIARGVPVKGLPATKPTSEGAVAG